MVQSGVQRMGVRKNDQGRPDSGAGPFAVEDPSKSILQFEYDFAKQGGAVGAIGLGSFLPDNAIIVGGFLDVITTFTSAADTATIAIHAESANDIVTAVAINVGTPWDAGLQAIIPDEVTIAGAFKTTQAREITATIAVQAVTAGRLRGYLEYVVGE